MALSRSQSRLCYRFLTGRRPGSIMGTSVKQIRAGGFTMVADGPGSTSELWKARYRLPIIYWTQVAAAAPDRGLALSNRNGVSQLYAWHVPTGELRQITHH